MEMRGKKTVSAEQAELLRQIPSVDELLAQARLAALSKRVDRNVVVEVARTVLADLRARIAGDSNWTAVSVDTASVEELISVQVENILSRSLQPVINATGVILHTNLGRAPLPETVVDEFRRTATQYSNLEYDLEAGARGKRDVHTSGLLTRLTGAEAAIVVNNCAAAVLVTLAALEGDGVSETTVKQSVEAGVSVVMLSGDKMLGGPQAGMIAGKKELIARVRRYPLFRALRVDKLTIAALEATLGAYLRAAWDEIPAIRMIRATPQELKRRAENFIRELRPELPLDEVEIETADGTSLAGGGSTPSQSLPTKIIRIASARYSATKLEQRLRRPPAGTSVIPRVEDDRLILDLRTVFPEQEPLLIKTLAAVLH